VNGEGSKKGRKVVYKRRGINVCGKSDWVKGVYFKAGA
jgi:hypothetical protein